jgi:hypothetical protein
MVVLPFANIGGGPKQDYFVDGVTESLTTDLSRISAFVIGRHTAFTYKGKAVDLKRIGRELNVRYVLEGSRSAQRQPASGQRATESTPKPAATFGPSGSKRPSLIYSICRMKS